MTFMEQVRERVRGRGLRRPINDVPRGCSVQDMMDVAAITALQAIG